MQIAERTFRRGRLNILNWSTVTIIGIIICSTVEKMMRYSMGKGK